MESGKSPSLKFLGHFAFVVALVGAMASGGVGVWPRVNFWQQDRLAKRVLAELEADPHAEIQVVLKQVAGLGEPGIEALVIAAASERADIALAARRVIEEKMAAWRIRAERDANFLMAGPTAILAAALAKHVESFGAFGQQWVARLTLDVVDLADSFEVEAAVPVLADCSAVLNAVPALGPRMLTPENGHRHVEHEDVALDLPKLEVPTLRHAQVAARSTARTGGELAKPIVASKSAGNSRGDQELLRSTAIPRDSKWVPEWTARPNAATATAPSVLKETAAKSSASEKDLVEVPSPEEQADLVDSFQSLATRELLAELSEADTFEAAAIREALHRRGFTTDELGLASRLFAADSAERLKLIDDLKVLPARTARRWLRELLADDNAEVRHDALAALATTQDPELRAIARDIAIRDVDRRVVELASQIMRESR